jgi:hypothetical protein
MGLEEQQQPNYRGSQFVRDNSSYNEASVIQIRLNTDAVIEKVQIFLSGRVTIFETNPENGRITKSVKEMGKRKCNDDGLQAILGFVNSIINSQVVQGNYEIQQYKDHCFFIRNELTKMIVINMYRWQIDTKEAESTIDFIMNMIEPFLSRLVENKERESYSSSLQVKESMNSDRSRGGIFSSIFGGNK